MWAVRSRVREREAGPGTGGTGQERREVGGEAASMEVGLCEAGSPLWVGRLTSAS